MTFFISHSGIIETNISFITKTCEGNWTTKWNIEEYKPTNVWVNGREIHPLDIDHFRRLRLPIKEVERGQAAFWVIKENGEVSPEIDESQGKAIEKVDFSSVSIIIEPARWIPFAILNDTPKSKRHKVKKKIMPGSGTVEGYFVYPIRFICGTTVQSTECRFSQLKQFHEYVSRIYKKLKKISSSCNLSHSNKINFQLQTDLSTTF